MTQPHKPTSPEMEGADDTNAIEAALAKLRWYGIDIASPRDGDLDDLEQERYNGFVDACRAYLAALAPTLSKGGTTEPVASEQQLVWVQNLIGFIEGKFPADERWKAIFVERLSALAASNSSGGSDD